MLTRRNSTIALTWASRAGRRRSTIPARRTLYALPPPCRGRPMSPEFLLLKGKAAHAWNEDTQIHLGRSGGHDDRPPEEDRLRPRQERRRRRDPMGDRLQVLSARQKER